MFRYRLLPPPAQATVLRGHCAHARFVGNLAVEQQLWWRPGRGSGPGWDMTRSAKGTVAEPGRKVRAKTALNREILASGWGVLIKRLEQKAPGRIEKINPAHTSQRRSAGGQVAGENRKSQAVFACTACRYTCNTDVNAAKNIAAGHAVTARGGVRVAGPVNREPQLTLLTA
jgi:putative transposase